MNEQDKKFQGVRSQIYSVWKGGKGCSQLGILLEAFGAVFHNYKFFNFFRFASRTLNLYTMTLAWNITPNPHIQITVQHV